VTVALLGVPTVQAELAFRLITTVSAGSATPSAIGVTSTVVLTNHAGMIGHAGPDRRSLAARVAVPLNDEEITRGEQPCLSSLPCQPPFGRTALRDEPATCPPMNRPRPARCPVVPDHPRLARGDSRGASHPSRYLTTIFRYLVLLVSDNSSTDLFPSATAMR
jgi:hypothetical protein